MASSKEYLDFILGQLSELEDMVLCQDLVQVKMRFSSS